MSTQPSPPAVSPVIVLAGVSCSLKWDKAAMCRADEIGLFQTKGVGLARAAKYIWAMLANDQRASYASYVELANDLPPLNAAWAAIDAAIQAAGEGMHAKNVFGSTSGRSPSSS